MTNKKKIDDAIKDGDLAPLPQEMPQVTKEPFLTKRKGNFVTKWIRSGRRPVPGEEIKDISPIMIYIDDNMDGRIVKNVKTGLLRPKKADGSKNSFPHEITSNKKITLHYDNEEIPLYIQFEKERFCYPLEPKIDARKVYNNEMNLVANYRKYDESQKESWLDFDMQQVKVWLMLVGGFIGVILLAIYVGDIFGVWDLLFSGGAEDQILALEDQIRNYQQNQTTGTVVVP